jgi:hypothetical protein
MGVLRTIVFAKKERARPKEPRTPASSYFFDVECFVVQVMKM